MKSVSLIPFHFKKVFSWETDYWKNNRKSGAFKLRCSNQYTMCNKSNSKLNHKEQS